MISATSDLTYSKSILYGGSYLLTYKEDGVWQNLKEQSFHVRFAEMCSRFLRYEQKVRSIAPLLVRALAEGVLGSCRKFLSYVSGAVELFSRGRVMQIEEYIVRKSAGTLIQVMGRLSQRGRRETKDLPAGPGQVRAVGETGRVRGSGEIIPRRHPGDRSR